MTGDNEQDRIIQSSGSADSDTTAAFQQGRHREVASGSVSRGQVLQPGSTLGRYEILECIDNGGMGVVYRARHTALGKIVALKVVSTVLQSEPRAMNRFLREMQAIGRLEAHPNVLNAYDAGDEDGVQYIATELIEGIQLGSLVKKMGLLSVSEACKIVSQAALALNHLRKHDLVHRDIKPSNLMLTREGTVKVVDMGLALLRDEQADQITMVGETMGSIDYMAPEQWQDCHNVDWRSDVYSLGCTFYCLLAGEAPFSDHHKGSVARMRAHLQSEFPDIREKRTDVPDQAAELLAAMTTKDPERRLTDLEKLSEQLEIIVSGDLKGLVERGFAQIHDQPVKEPPAKRWHPNPIQAKQSIDVDAAKQQDQVAKSEPKSTGTRVLIAATGAIACLLGLFALSHFSNKSDDIGDTNPSEASTTPAADLSSDASPITDRSADPGMSKTRRSLKAPLTLIGHQAKVMDAVFLATQNKLASVSDDGVLCIFDLASPEKPLHRVEVSDRGVASITHDPETDTLAIVCADGQLQICSATDGKVGRTESLGGGLTSLARIPSTDAFAVTNWDGDVRRVDLLDANIENRLITSRAEVVYDIDVSADGSLMAWVGRDPLVTLYDVEQQLATDLSGHEKWVYDVAISPDGRQLATAGHEGVVRLWALPSGEPQSQIEYVVPQALCFFPDSRHLAIGGRGTTVQVWDLDANRSIHELPVGKPIDCIAISDDAKLLAAGANDGTLKVWHIAPNPTPVNCTAEDPSVLLRFGLYRPIVRHRRDEWAAGFHSESGIQRRGNAPRDRGGRPMLQTAIAQRARSLPAG